MHTIYQPTNSANMPAITTQLNDCADVPIIYRLTNKQALYLTTITTRRLYRTTT